MTSEIEQEILSSGAPCLKINDGSKKIQDDTDGSKKIQDATDGSKKIQGTTSSSDPCDGDSSSKATQKFKLKWTETLENQFHNAIQHLGVHKATPRKILKLMNQKFLTKAHIASKLQKFRKHLGVEEECMKMERRAMCPNPTCGYMRLGNTNLFNVQPGYGLGQSSSMMNNIAGLHDPLNYMNHRPAYDLSQSGCNLFPGRGNLGFQNGMLPLKEEWRSIPGTSQAPWFGPYGTTSNVLGMNYNPTTGTTGRIRNNYPGNIRDENGYLVGPGGMRINGNGSFSGVGVQGTGSDSLQRMGSVHGNGHESLGGIRGHGPGYGSLEGIRVPGEGHGSLNGIRIHGNDNGIRVHNTSNGYGSFGGVKVHGNGSPDGIIGHGNDSLSGIRFHGTGYVGGTRVHGNDTGYVGGVNVHGTSNGNGSLGMNWNFNDNMSNHGSSTSMFPYALSSFLDNKDQSQNNLIAQTSGVIPALQNPELFNDHHDINKVFPGTNNYQFHQNQDFEQHQGNLTRENLETPTAYPLEDINSWSFSDGANNEEILNTFATNPEMYLPTQDINIKNQGNNHEEILNPGAANPEIYFPTQDMNITNQDYDDEDFLNSLLGPDMN